MSSAWQFPPNNKSSTSPAPRLATFTSASIKWIFVFPYPLGERKVEKQKRRKICLMHETLRWWLISWENNFPIHLVKILDDEVKRFSKAFSNKWLNDDESKNSRNNRRLLGEMSNFLLFLFCLMFEGWQLLKLYFWKKSFLKKFPVLVNFVSFSTLFIDLAINKLSSLHAITCEKCAVLKIPKNSFWLCNPFSFSLNHLLTRIGKRRNDSLSRLNT